jgi:nitrite reductase/ring-hydroxylating ferredoxin subunit
MERREFIRVGGLACIAGVTAGCLVSCAGGRYIDAILKDEDLRVPLTSLASSDGKPLSYAVVRHPELKWPIALYRSGNDAYRALLMRCTHQDTQLKASDGELLCPAHGSSFSTDGGVTSGPAEQALRQFPTRVEGDELLISLKG